VINMEKLLYEKDGHIATITFNRPEAKNALDTESLVGLVESLEDFEKDDNLRVVIVTGAGDEAFSSGADLGALMPILTGAKKPETEAERKLAKDPGMVVKCTKGLEIYKPIIGAVNGFCVAGGMEILQSFDIRIASEKAMFGLSEVKRSIVPGGGSTVRLPQQIPYCMAMEILLTGDMITAEEAWRLGLINKVVPQDKVMETARQYANTIAENGPLAVRAIKKSVIKSLNLPQEEAFAKETAIAVKVLQSEDAREGPRAFKEKRKPVYKGK
jgi:enoyl-CoA hydratase